MTLSSQAEAEARIVVPTARLVADYEHTNAAAVPKSVIIAVRTLL